MMNLMPYNTFRDDTAQLQQDILASLSSAPGDAAAQCKRLQPFLHATREETCRIILSNLVQINFDNDNACKHWDAIVDHASTLHGSLSRSVGLATAACDYFSTINPRLANPKLVEFHRLEETLNSAHRDFLTGLLSRGTFQELFEQDISRAKRHCHNSTLIFFDLDNFKEINDTYGHPAGDKVLKKIGEILLQTKRREDMACRYGGDEFVILLPETNKFMGTLVAEKLHEILDTLIIRHNGDDIRVRCSGGLASFPVDSANAEELIEYADKALYDAKRRGRQRLVLFAAEDF